MDIGEEKREIIVVPIEEPAPGRDPVGPAYEPNHVPAEPVKEPVGV